MRFPIDTSGLRFVVVAPAEPLDNSEPREAWALGTDEDGEVLWRVALGDGDGDVLRVAVPGDARVAAGETVAVDELVALTWRLAGRSGVSLRARTITATGERAVSEGG